MFYTADVGFSVSQYFASIIHTLIKMCLMCDANFGFKVALRQRSVRS